MEDTFRHKGMRARLVQTLEEKGIKRRKILDAIGKVPRHFFIEKGFDEWAYKDKAFKIGYGQTISQPYTVAYQTALLNVKKRDAVLEIGTGSGYQSAILAELGANVYTLERYKPLYIKAKALLEKLNYNKVYCFHKDGHKGLPKYAPFDKILFTAGATELPEFLLPQLSVGGYIVVPIGAEVQKMARLTKVSTDNTYELEWFDEFRFVPFRIGLEY